MKIKLTDDIHLDFVEFAVGNNENITVCFSKNEANNYSINRFYLSKTEITEAQWNVIQINNLIGPTVCGHNPINLKGPTRNSSNQPLLGVNWFEAFIWCGKLTEKLRNKGMISMQDVICLPTLPEWFYAFKKTERCKNIMVKDFIEWSQDGPPVRSPSNNLKPNPYHIERMRLIKKLEYYFEATPNRFPLVTGDGDWDAFIRYQTNHNLPFRLRSINAADRQMIDNRLKFGFRVCKIRIN